MDFTDILFPWNLLGLLFSGMWTLVSVGAYIWIALCLYIIAKKTNTENPWMAWVPILNMWLMVQIAQKEAWWMILFFVPIAGVVASVVVTMAIAERVGKPSWWGILTIVPGVNLIVPGYLAWG